MRPRSAGSTRSRRLPLHREGRARAARNDDQSAWAAIVACRPRTRSSASSRPAAPPACRASSRSPPTTSPTGRGYRRAATPPAGLHGRRGLVSTYGAGPFVAGALTRRLRPARRQPYPGRLGQHRAADDVAGIRKLSAMRAHAVLRAPPGRMGARAGASTGRLRRQPPARRRRAGRRRAGDARPARGGLGRQGHRDHGHRRHRRLAVGRVRRAGTACISAAAASSMSS